MVRFASRVGLVVVTLLAVVTTGSASAGVPGGSVGHDVSYPQCTSTGASTTTVGTLGGAFGVVGVTGGRPWGPNSCSGSEFSWAAGLANAPALYMNTANPAPTSSYYWPTSGSTDPVLCSNATATTDPGCAYDYGWHAAQNALLTQASSIPNAGARTWWLDVETGNSWNGNGTSNAADLQGSVDYLRSHGVAQIGLYSTSSQWSTITGGYRTDTAASYASAWQPEFTAQYPMTTAPNWIAGLGTASAASTACASTFTGGPTLLAQYNDGSGYDADLACGTTAPSAAQNLAATGQDSAIGLAWTAPVSSGGAPVTYSVVRGLTAGGETTTPVVSGLSSTSYTDTAVTNGTTYFYEVIASNSVGSAGPSNEASATPAPVPQSFGLLVSPNSGTAKRGSTLNSTVTVTESGAAQTVMLSATGAPAGVSVMFNPPALSATGSSTMTITLGGSARGTYAITITGTGATNAHTATYTLKIR